MFEVTEQGYISLLKVQTKALGICRVLCVGEPKTRVCIFYFRWASQHVYWGRAWKSAEPCRQTTTGEQRQTTHHVQGVDPMQVSQASRSSTWGSWRKHRTQLQVNLIIFRWCGCLFLNPKEQRMSVVVVIKGLELYGYTISRLYIASVAIMLHDSCVSLSLQVIFIEMPFWYVFKKTWNTQFYMHEQIKIFTLTFSMFKFLALEEINDNVFLFPKGLTLKSS